MINQNDIIENNLMLYRKNPENIIKVDLNTNLDIKINKFMFFDIITDNK